MLAPIPNYYKSPRIVISSPMDSAHVWQPVPVPAVCQWARTLERDCSRSNIRGVRNLSKGDQRSGNLLRFGRVDNLGAYIRSELGFSSCS